MTDTTRLAQARERERTALRRYQELGGREAPGEVRRELARARHETVAAVREYQAAVAAAPVTGQRAV
jgi:hypothetical protein